MLPVSSATTSCSCNIQIPIHGGLKSFSNCSNVAKVVKNFSNSSKRRPVSCFFSNYDAKCFSIDTIDQSYENGCSSQVGFFDESHYVGTNSMIFVDSLNESAGEDQLIDFINRNAENTDPGFSSSVSGVPVDPPSVSESFDVDLNSLSSQKTNISDIVAKMNDSIANTINGGDNVLTKSLDTITSTLNNALMDANKAFGNLVNDINSFVNKSGESAGNKLIGISGELKKGSGRAGAAALDVFRQTIVIVEEFLVSGARNVGYAYGFAKAFLPQEFRDALNLSEESIVQVLTPVGTAFQQVYIVLEGFEERLGLDPNDPLIPLVLFLGVSATLWGSYRLLKYSGYAGDLSPESAFELLRGNENVVLIDIRPENLRERDGIPDLRRRARFRYISVTPSEVDGSVKKQLKGGRDIDDLLLAAVIRNLKVVEDRSKVLVMDADGTCSKGVARSLRKLGIKRPYQVQGGFRSWLNEGFRVKELKPETTLTILNEEAEAILEEINPTPLKLIGFGVGVIAAAYSLSEWEKTLQFIGVIGIGQTIYQRVASYRDAEDLKQDVRLLLAPVSLAGQVISRATGKLETNRNGLPTSPSSSDVQSRVLQAAAKHESQPTDGEETQDLPVSGNEKVNASEA